MRPLKVKEKTKQPKKQNNKILKLDVCLKSTENKDKNLKPKTLKTKTTFLLPAMNSGVK